MLAGQNKYWGNSIEESVKYWLGFGIEHLMVKGVNNTPLIRSDGEVRAEDFRRLGRLQKEYGVKFHVHPYRVSVKRNNKEILLDALSAGKDLYRRILQEMDSQIQENGLYPLIDLHLTVLDDPKLDHSQSEKEGLRAGREFFQNLELESDLALETMHDPYRNKGFSLIGNKAEHFAEIIGNKDFGICIDTGHLVMAEEPLKKFLDLPYPVLSVHYNGNDRKSDSHHIPTRENVKDVELVEGLLKTVKGPIVLEIRNHNYSKEEVKRLVEKTKRGIV